MKPSIPLVLPLLTLAACQQLVDGVWQISIQATANVEQTCTDNISHNFSDAWVPSEEEEEESSWTTTDQASDSDQVFFALITGTGPDTATLVIGDLVYPGVMEAEGSWTFSWSDLSSASSSNQHETGYQWSSVSDESRETVYDLAFEADFVTGTLAWASTTSYNWSESDSWSAEDLAPYLGGDGTIGQIPAGSFLVTEEYYTGTTLAASNDSSPDFLDCDDTECAINRIQTCSASYELSGERTALSSGEDYEGVHDAGQDAGY